MAIKELIDQIRSQLPGEVLQSTGTLLEQVKSEGVSLTDSLAAANSESKNRKIKIRELEDKLQDTELSNSGFQKKIEDLKKEYDTSEIQLQFDSLKSKYEGILKREKDSFIQTYGKIKDHPNFEKSKTWFKIPVNGEEINWDGLDDESLEYNIESLNKLNSLDYFGEVGSGSPIGSKGQAGIKSNSQADVLDIRNKYGYDSKEYRTALAEYMKNK